MMDDLVLGDIVLISDRFGLRDEFTYSCSEKEKFIVINGEKRKMIISTKKGYKRAKRYWLGIESGGFVRVKDILIEKNYGTK
jgi:hypothetical protein